MEWCIPIQTFQVENVQLASVPQGIKPTISLGYKDNDMTFSSLNILLPALTIKSYTQTSGKLTLSLEDMPQILRKLNMLQDTILSSVFINQQRWFPQQTFLRKQADIKNTFQPIIQNTEMNLYCPMSESDNHGPNIYTNNKWTKGTFESGLLAPGVKIRVVIRLHGISFHVHQPSDQWSGKFRLQHRILAVLVPSTPPIN